MVAIKNVLNLEKVPQFQSQKLQMLRDKSGTIRLLTAGKFDGYTNHKMDGLQKGEILAIPIGGNFDVKYHNGFYYSANNCIFTAKDGVDLEYVRYYFLNCYDTFQELYQGWGIKKFNVNQFLELKLHLPNLQKQEEIVQILNTLTTHTSELTARKKQYNHYMEKLLTFGDGVEWKKLGEVGEVRMCKRILKAQTKSEGDIPFYKIGTFGKCPDAYISRTLFEEYKKKYNYPKIGDILISASGTIGRTVIFNGENSYFQDSNIVWIENDESMVLNKFLFYYYKIANWSVSDGGTIQRLYNNQLKSLPIPIPPLPVQKEIVAILDKFDALTNSTKQGLQKEIELRTKQYEYYRNQLLNFGK